MGLIFQTISHIKFWVVFLCFTQSRKILLSQSRR